MESFQTNCFPFPLAVPARMKAADSPTVELVLVLFQPSLYTYLPPATGKLRNKAKEAQRQMGAAVWKMRSASDSADQGKQTIRKGVWFHTVSTKPKLSHT